MEWWSNGLLGKNCRVRLTQQSSIPTLHHSIPQMEEPEVVATSPYPIKSPVPAYCGFSSVKMARSAEAQRAKTGARGRICTCTGDALNVVSLRVDYASGQRRPKAGQSQDSILQPVMLRQ